MRRLLTIGPARLGTAWEPDVLRLLEELGADAEPFEVRLLVDGGMERHSEAADALARRFPQVRVERVRRLVDGPELSTTLRRAKRPVRSAGKPRKAPRRALAAT